jgi:Domain of unknown function (DUF4845)
MRNGQRGVSIMGLLVVLVVIIFVALLGMKIVPSFLEFRSIKTAIDAIAKQAQSPGDVRRLSENRAAVDDIQSVKATDLEVTRDGSAVVVAVAYRKEIKLFGPVGLVIDYAANSKGGS